MEATPPPRARCREWIGLAVIALPCMLYSMDLTVLNLAVPRLTRISSPAARSSCGSWMEAHHSLALIATRGRTRMTFVSRIITAEAGSEAYLAGVERGWSQTFDKLQATF